MPHADGPCSAAKYDATLAGSLLTMKLICPWRYSATSFERCTATRENPNDSKTPSSTPGVGEANSTNSKPSSPIGLSNRSAMVSVQFDARLLHELCVFCLLALEERQCRFGRRRIDHVPLLRHRVLRLGHRKRSRERIVQALHL